MSSRDAHITQRWDRMALSCLGILPLIYELRLQFMRITHLEKETKKLLTTITYVISFETK